MRSESQIKQALGIWNYPYDALEAVVNALYHRDYRQYEPVEDLKSRVRIRKMMKAEPTITLKGIAELLGVTSRTIERTVGSGAKVCVSKPKGSPVLICAYGLAHWETS